jgi:hypothetical protein
MIQSYVPNGTRVQTWQGKEGIIIKPVKQDPPKHTTKVLAWDYEVKLDDGTREEHSNTRLSVVSGPPKTGPEAVRRIAHALQEIHPSAYLEGLEKFGLDKEPHPDEIDSARDIIQDGIDFILAGGW